MTSMTEQVQLAIENFDLTIVPGSVKKLMAGIKAVYESEAPEATKLKGAGGSSDLWKVPVNELKVLEGFNVRLPGPDLDAHIEFLTDSILEEGFFQHRPLAALIIEVGGVPGLYVFDGHCRLTSVQNAIAKGSDIKMLPVVVQDARNVDLDDLFVQMHRLNKGKELAPLEIGILCKRLTKNGHDDKTIGKRMGIKAQYVDGLVRLVNAPKPLVDAVKSNELAASEAIKMIRAFSNGGVVQELEVRRARALAEMQAKAPTNTESDGAVETVPSDEEKSPVATLPRPRLTARHASDAHVKKAVRKHGMDLFETTRALKQDPAYASLSEVTRLRLEGLLAQLAEAEKADALPGAVQDEMADVIKLAA
jgi:ParB family transcriptional regulator, chromosome partitioning protein